MFVKSLIGFVVATSVSIPTLAWVDIKTGNYAHTVRDLVVDGAGPVDKIDRTYNSLSSSRGLFGYGWCSNLETSLQVLGKGLVAVRNCGAGQIKLFKSSSYSVEENEKSIDALVKLVREKAPKGVGLPKSIKSDFTRDIYLRDDFARSYDFSAEAVDQESFAHIDESLVFAKDEFVLTGTDGITSKFGKNGKLKFISDNHENQIEFQYKRDRLDTILDARKNRFVFKYSSDGYVAEINGPNGGKATYKYSSSGDLLSSQGATIESYAYDDSHNMTSLTQADRSYKIKYEAKRDAVAEVQIQSCKVKYEFKPGNSENYAVEMSHICSEKLVEKVKFNFAFKIGPDGQQFQSELSAVNLKGEKLETKFAAEGQPVSKVRKGVVSEYFYDEKGRLKSEKFDKFRADVTYDPAGRMASLKLTDSSNVKKPDVQTTKFSYSKDGSLISAKGSKGLETKLSYDGSGRLVGVKNSRGQEAKLSYNATSRTPSQVEVKGMGKAELIQDRFKVLSGARAPANASAGILMTYEQILDPVLPALKSGVVE